MEFDDKSNKIEVFCRYIRKNGKIIYPKNARLFHFWVDAESSNMDTSEMAERPDVDTDE